MLVKNRDIRLFSQSVMKLVIATRNIGKLAEIKELLQGLDFEIKTLADYPEFGELPEDGTTFIENATKKAITVAKLTGHLTLADDSGLEVTVLGGAPGIKSARYAKNDVERNKKLLDALKLIPWEQRTARFVCAIAIVQPNGNIQTVQETCDGFIAFEPQGTNGFGFDPIFYYPPLGKTFAELSRTEKSKYSHRGKALRAARKILEQLITYTPS
ncbi:MAG: XTP/dITP diphosphatase [bacterium]|nr:XTP/dITP diphosphatase [bacterium]